jgi:peptide deformylase
MATLDMRRYGDAILRQAARPVGVVTPEIKRLVADMVDTMWREVGIGLAAPQVGVALRIFVMDDRRGGARALIDPVITEARGSVRAEEGCLSVPGVFAEVERRQWLRVSALDAEGQPLELTAEGLEARIVQHEIDHLDGVLFIDRLPPVTRDRIKRRIQKDGFPADTGDRAFAL